ncbi:Amb_all domain repeat protein [Syntrophotalea carbinolica DSM 2380]|uniref:Amb_all domain repeat protein n=1 Tax=Syntrophotalea carbinolica (strain DSM 2380 / NBRC 103641 / GraBd1) TaxID=338963 RepID=Q3A4E4_SYNC1|nr:hypothetical protein [Syntrophotalea carbinolica]ABA88763.1 Amb_all domain repeat protein [Syntrophotalea carbinolica DSM 2380]
MARNLFLYIWMSFAMVVMCCMLTTCSYYQISPQRGELKIYPGAEGYGTETPGGRGGQIIKVTNLNDSGTGSLRAAIQASGARIVVFEVSGIIELQSELIITNPYITIAGQTAPAPGIMLKNRRLKVSAHDVVIQHIRVRPGDERSYNTSEEGERDCLGIVGHSDIYNVVVDHCSFQWAVDEVIGLWGYSNSRLDNITISNCIVSEGLDNSIHPKGAHSKGFLIGDYAKKVTVLRNLISSSDDRNGPNAKGGTTSVVINNYVYNAGRSGRMHYSDSYGAGPLFQSTVGNVFRDGPEYATQAPLWWADNTKSGSQVYASDNLIQRLDESVASVPLMDPPSWGNPQVSTPPVPYDNVTILPTDSVKSYVLKNSGARPAERWTTYGDRIDERVISDVWNGSGAMIDTPAQGGGWPTYAQNTRQFVAPGNPNGDDDGDGYTNIEEVLHQMAASVE